MATEIDIPNFIKIIMDEIGCDENKAEKTFLETIKKWKSCARIFLFMNGLTNVLANLE